MYITTVDLEIQTLNANGVPTSPSVLYGVVRNSQGELIQELSFEDLKEEAQGYYTYRNYDVSDTQKFPGTYLTVFWCTKSDDISPERALSVYDIFGEHSSGFKNRLFTWCPSYKQTNLYGYEVYRTKPDESEEIPIARTVFPYWFDETEYANEAEFQNSTFRVRELVWDDRFEEGLGPDRYVGKLAAIESNHVYCRLYGRIVDVIGHGRPQMLSFYVHEVDAPQEIDDSYLMRRNEVNVHINSRGEFSVPLIQGALVTAEISDAGISHRFVVPRAHTCQFKELDFYPLDTNYRAQ